MTPLSGSLEVITLPALVRFLGRLTKSGTLRAADGRWTGEVAFDHGQVVAAAFGAERGLPALEAIALGLRTGQFTFVEGDVPAARNVDVPLEDLAARLDALLDPTASVLRAVPSLAAVPRVAALPDGGQTPASLALTRGAVQTLLAVDGRRTVADLAAGRGLAATARHLAALAEAGLVTVGQPEGPPAEAAASAAALSTPAAPLTPPTPPGPAPQTSAAPPIGPAAPAPETARAQPAEPLPVGATNRLMLGAPPAPVGEPAPALHRPEAAAPPVAAAPATRGACPRLGFVDDPANHFSRPTQLHRCFAGVNPQRIATEDQRELCLTERFPVCARFVAAAASPAARAPDALRPRDPPGRAAQAAAAEASKSPATAEGPPAGLPAEPAAGVAGALIGARAPAERAAQAPAGVVPPPGLAAPPPRADDTRDSRAARAARAAPAVPDSTAAAGRAATSVVALAAPAPESGTREAEAAGERVDAALAPPPAARRNGSGAPTARGWPALSGDQIMVAALALAGVLALLLVLWRTTGQRAVQPPRPGDSLVASPGRPAGSPPAAGGLRTVLDERFGGGASGWPDNPQSTAWLADGVYRLVARQPGQFVAVGAPGGQRFRDVVVTAAFRKVAGPPGGGYGIIVRDQGPGPRDGVHQGGRYYVLEAGDRGEFGIWRREGDRWVDLIPWTRSDAIAQGTAPNTLVVQAVGPQLTFIANGVRLASYTDTALAGGAVGIFVGGDLNEAVLERFTIQAPG